MLTNSGQAKYVACERFSSGRRGPSEQGKEMETNVQFAANFDATAILSNVPARSPKVPASTGQKQADAACAGLDTRLSYILKALVEGFECSAAEVYLLDDSNRELQLRVHHQAGESEPGDSRRPLDKARADVAAMSGSAIVLEDDVAVADWPVPVWSGAALCLPVSSDQTIHGTMWLYSREPRPFSDAELAMAEVFAGRVAVELELDALRKASNGLAGIRQAESVEFTKPKTQPQPIAEEWEIAGLYDSSLESSSLFDCQTLADGRTLLVAGTLVGESENPAALFQAARIALRAHAVESLDAGELLTRTNHTLWSASPGGEGLAIAVALLERDGGRASVAMAEAAAALRWRSSTCDVIRAESPALGWSEKTAYVGRNFNLNVRERLVLLAPNGGTAGKEVLTTLCDQLQKQSSAELRSLPARRALRQIADTTAEIVGPASFALARRS